MARRPATRVRATAIIRAFAKPTSPTTTTTGTVTSAPVRCGAWLTQNRVGILNSTENVPLTIDAQYVAGFNWARQPAIRYVQDVGQIAWFGVSVEAC